MNQKIRIISLALALITFTSTASQAARIVTAPLAPPVGGSLHCRVGNASDSNTIIVEITIYDFSGVILANGPVTITVAPNASVLHLAGGSGVSPRHCAVEVLEGGRKNARVSATALDSGNNIVEVVTATP